MPRLNAKLVASAQAGEKEYVVWDTKVSGFGLRVRPTGNKAYIFVYRPRGRSKVRKITIGPPSGISFEKARGEAERLLSEKILGNDPARINAERRINTVEATFPNFLSLHLSTLSKRRSETVESLFERLVFPEIGDKPLGEVTRRDIRCITDRLLDSGKPSAANLAHAAISTFLSWCVDRELIDFNPLRGSRRPARKTSRDRVLKKDELVALWRATERIPAHWRTAIRLLMATGQRRSEVLHARWEEFDLYENVWNLPAERSKNGEGNSIPLSTLALELLQGIDHPAGAEYLFPSRLKRKRCGKPMQPCVDFMGNVVRKLRPCVASPDWRIHDLRRSAATHLASMKVAPHIIEAILNHRGGTVSGVAAVYNRYPNSWRCDEKRHLQV